MCTAFSIVSGDHYFGRNLDLDHHYNENVTITPRGFIFPFRHVKQPQISYAMIGIATVMDGYPLYYEAVNEKGLSMAGLNFPGNAVYKPFDPAKVNIPSFELIPWVLKQCETVQQAKEILTNINLCDTAFREDLPPTPLHWILCDRHNALTLEPMRDGLVLSGNPVCVLTNNPHFSYHMQNLSNFMNLTSRKPCNRFSDKLDLTPYSLGMGAIGLPGDYSSASRFVRCAFLKENAIFTNTEEHRVSQIFHILDGVSQFEGCVETPQGYEKTLYSICCNTTKGIFYYTTYCNRQITAVNMRNEDLNGAEPITYPLINRQQILTQN